MPDWFWYIPGPVVVVGYVIFYVWTRRQRASAGAAAAASRGWEYAGASGSQARRYSGWPFDGRGARARNVITGTHRGRRFVAYEFSFRIGIESKYADDGLFRNRCRYQVVSVSHDVPSVPVFTVQTHDALTRVVSATEDDMIGIGRDEFDQKFAVASRERAQVKQILTDQLCAWLAADSRTAEAPLRFEDGDVVTWRSGVMDVAATVEAVNFLNDVIDRLPLESAPTGKGA